MPHELEKLDRYFGLEPGTSYTVLIQHRNPAPLNPSLAPHGIVLDEYGMVPKNQHENWQRLMKAAGISQVYWKDKELLLPEASPKNWITNLEVQ